MRERASSPASPLRVLFTLGAAGTMSDGDLLRRFLDGRPEEAECAFAALVERHGPMVRRACLAVLGDPHEAADASQAAFLVLARRAGSIRGAGSVGPWLFGVSRRVALRARAAAARRRRAERIKAERAARDLAAEPTPPDDWAALHEELDRLPARYRDPLVLCDLQGLAHARAAALLGCPVPTLRTRLSRARDRLRARLVRRGLSPASASAPLLAPAASLPLGPSAATLARLAASSRGLPLSAFASSAPLAASTLRSLTMIAVASPLSIAAVALLGLGAGVAGYAALGPPVGARPTPDAPPPPAARALAQRDAEAPGLDLADAGEDHAPLARAGTPQEIAPRPIRSEVDRDLAIRTIVPDGAVVAEGEVLCELDTGPLRAPLSEQQFETERAQASYMNAVKDREIAEMGVWEYIDGLFPLEELAASGDVDVARAELELANLRLARAEATPEDADRELRRAEARVGAVRAEMALQKAKLALDVVRLSSATRIKSLEGVVEKAKADELMKRSIFEREKEREELIRRTIEKATIHAPVAGVVRYPEGFDRVTPVRKGQLLVRIEPLPEDAAEPDRPGDPD